MSVNPSQAVSITFRTKDIDGVLADATGTPTAVLYRNGAATAVVVTVASITGTGRYSASWTNAGYVASDQLEVEVTATVAGTAYTSKVWGDGVVAIVVAPDNAGITANGVAIAAVPTAEQISLQIADDINNEENEWDSAANLIVTNTRLQIERTGGMLALKPTSAQNAGFLLGLSRQDAELYGDEQEDPIGSQLYNPVALTASERTQIANSVWTAGTRTLTSIADSTGMTTLLTRITGLLQTKVQADTDQTAVISAVDNVPTVDEIVSGIRDDSAPYSPSNINLTRKIGSTQSIYIAWATTGATITGTKSINGDPSSAIVGSIVEMSPQPYWDIPVGQFWYELEYDVDDRVLEPAIVEHELTDGSESQVIAVAIVR